MSVKIYVDELLEALREINATLIERLNALEDEMAGAKRELESISEQLREMGNRR